VSAGPRVGLGVDVHALAPPGPLLLGGVRVPHDRGLVGHSDADVLAHAVADALLGAAGLGDLGALFPSDDERWRGADSLDLLAAVAARLRSAGWTVGNVDATVVAERPALAPYTAAMAERLASACGVADGVIVVRAKSSDGLGLAGRGEGVAALAVALVVPQER